MKPRSLQIKFTRQASGYKIVIGHNLLDQAGPWARKCLGSEAAKAVIVSNPVVYRLYGRKVEKSLLAAGFTVSHFLMKDGERHKDFGSTESALKAFAGF